MGLRSILGLLNIAQGLRELGEDPTPALRRHGLDLEALDPLTCIERTRELRLYTEIAQTLRDPTAGLKLGSRFSFTSYGPLVMLWATCANAYESFQLAVRYQPLTFLFSTLGFEPCSGQSAVVLTPVPMPALAFRLLADGEMAGTFKLMRDMQAAMGLDILPERVDMPYPMPAEAAQIEAHFGCPVRFGEPVGRLWVRNEHLQWRFPTADAAAHAMYRALCDQQLAAQRTAPEQLAERVAAHLDLFVQHYPDAAEVARSFGVSERTLRRQLQLEGASFRALLGQARHRKAQQLLQQTRLPVEAIAAQLGYAESAAFVRAFKTWAGMTPAAFRRPAGRASRQ